MQWQEQYKQDNKPSLEKINEFVDNTLWLELCDYIEGAYAVAPSIEYSRCSMEPGWNVKYKKGSKSICTLYVRQGFFTCLLVVSAKNSKELAPVLDRCEPYIQNLYQEAKPFNDCRWLMIDVTTPKLLENVQQLLVMRVKPMKKKV